MIYHERIEINPEIRFGKPCIKDTRITVYDILSWLSVKMTTNEIIEDFPELTESDIIACLVYAADKERKLKIVV